MGNPNLSSREKQVLDLIGLGKSYKQIAAELGISQKTVENHCNRIFAKTGKRSRLEAALLSYTEASNGI